MSEFFSKLSQKENRLLVFQLASNSIVLSLYSFYLIASLVSHRSIYENLNYIGFILVFAPRAWDDVNKLFNNNKKSYNYTLTVISAMLMSFGFFLVMLGSCMNGILKEDPNFHIYWTWYPWRNF
jgi:hypothetical protein